MKRLLQATICFLRRTTWETPAEWTAADARSLQTYLSTATGAKMMRLLTNEISAANERAAMSKGAAFECGWACGYRGLLAWWQSLAAPAPEEPPAIQAEELGHLAP